MIIYILCSVCFLPDFDMKKDIDTLIAEERTEIISKYDKVGVCIGHVLTLIMTFSLMMIMRLRLCNTSVE